MPFTVEDLIEEQTYVATVSLDDTVQKALGLMIEHGFSQLPVVDSESQPQGMITNDSILR